MKIQYDKQMTCCHLINSRDMPNAKIIYSAYVRQAYVSTHAVALNAFEVKLILQ
jgi:hypothetical protein